MKTLERCGAGGGSFDDRNAIEAISFPDVLISDIGMPETDGYQL